MLSPLLIIASAFAGRPDATYHLECQEMQLTLEVAIPHATQVAATSDLEIVTALPGCQAPERQVVDELRARIEDTCLGAGYAAHECTSIGDRLAYAVFDQLKAPVPHTMVVRDPTTTRWLDAYTLDSMGEFTEWDIGLTPRGGIVAEPEAHTTPYDHIDDDTLDDGTLAACASTQRQSADGYQLDRRRAAFSWTETTEGLCRDHEAEVPVQWSLSRKVDLVDQNRRRSG